MNCSKFSASRWLCVAILACFGSETLAANYQLLGWNNLGMHCMDSDYSVFSILPPYNTIEAQLIANGRLVTSSNGYSVTYEAVASPDGSFNSTAMGKGNYYEHAQSLYGANLGAEAGLAGWGMPGPDNTPQQMLFENTNHPAAGVQTSVNWFRAEGIPISPYNDAHQKDPYPLMRLIARDAGGAALATNDIVLPVSDEMDCRTCHASGTSEAAQPAAGWLWNGLPERDFRLNILRLHDEHEFALHNDLYTAALAARGFNPAGLYRSVVIDQKPVLCAACHASEALAAPSYGSIPPLTASVHGYHASVTDPLRNSPLDDVSNRSACYLCHPGSTTKCLRGAMGKAVAADGSMEMQCQSCHGNMTQVGSTNRVGWFMEPVCQSCHTGTATSNSGQIRFTSAFTDTQGTVRTPADSTFATQPNTPAQGLSLYRFSAGHGGLQCSACHGSTHAEFPSSHSVDNIRNIQLQGHAGVMIECTACHATMPNTANRGPHGMHSIGQGWITGGGGVTKHADALETSGGLSGCQKCHGADYRGTVLSQAQADRSFNVSVEGGTFTLKLYRGATIGCYTCHQGPHEEAINNSPAPTVTGVSADTTNDKSVELKPTVTGTAAVVRIISQPPNGSVGLANNTLTYFPATRFVGTETFTYAAYNGSKNSNLATGTVHVAQGPASVGVVAHVPPSYPAQWPVAFGAVASVTNNSSAVLFDWDYGDGTAHGSGPFVTHSYSNAGNYAWKVTVSVGVTSAQQSGNIDISKPVSLAGSYAHGVITLTWPISVGDSVLEAASRAGGNSPWTFITNSPTNLGATMSVSLPATEERFFRIRRPW